MNELDARFAKELARYAATDVTVLWDWRLWIIPAVVVAIVAWKAWKEHQ